MKTYCFWRHPSPAEKTEERKTKRRKQTHRRRKEKESEKETERKRVRKKEGGRERERERGHRTHNERQHEGRKTITTKMNKSQPTERSNINSLSHACLSLTDPANPPPPLLCLLTYGHVIIVGYWYCFSDWFNAVLRGVGSIWGGMSTMTRQPCKHDHCRHDQHLSIHSTDHILGGTHCLPHPYSKFCTNHAREQLFSLTVAHCSACGSKHIPKQTHTYNSTLSCSLCTHKQSHTHVHNQYPSSFSPSPALSISLSHPIWSEKNRTQCYRKFDQPEMKQCMLTILHTTSFPVPRRVGSLVLFQFPHCKRPSILKLNLIPRNKNNKLLRWSIFTIWIWSQETEQHMPWWSIFTIWIWSQETRIENARWSIFTMFHDLFITVFKNSDSTWDSLELGMPPCPNSFWRVC